MTGERDIQGPHGSQPAADPPFRFGPVALFLVLTFGISWGIDLAIALTVGHAAFMRLGMSPVQMMVPACAAMAVQRFVLPDSPLHPRRTPETSGWLLTLFPVLALLYGAVMVTALCAEDLSTILPGVGSLLLTLWVLSAFFLYGQAGVDAFTLTYLVRPYDPVLSFGLGVFGLAVLTLIVFWLLRDPVWETAGIGGRT